MENCGLGVGAQGVKPGVTVPNVGAGGPIPDPTVPAWVAYVVPLDTTRPVGWIMDATEGVSPLFFR